MRCHKPNGTKPAEPARLAAARPFAPPVPVADDGSAAAEGGTRRPAARGRSFDRMKPRLSAGPPGPGSPPRRPVAGRAVQRLQGAAGSAQDGKKAPFTVHQEFKDKHVANNAGEAESVTERRIDSGKPPGIVAGTAPNNLAKLADWETAIEDSDEVVPPKDQWGSEITWFEDDEQFVNSLARVEVAGWEAQGTKGNVQVKTTTNKKYVGGTWKVTDSETESDEYVDGSAKVSMSIEHLTS